MKYLLYISVVIIISLRCCDGCGELCHACDYERHKLNPLHERHGIVKPKCNKEGCQHTATTR